MEDVRRRSGHRDFMEEDERVDSIQDDKQEKNTAAKIGNKRPFEDNNESHDQYNSSPKEKHLIPSCSKQGSAITVAEGSSMGNDSRGSSSNQKQKEDQLESARAEMDEVKEENQRLKMYLDRIMKDYQTLQTQFYGIVQQDSKRKSTDTAVDDDHHRDETEESDRFVSLSLGRFSSDHDSNNKDEKNINSSTSHGTKGDEEVKEELSLGLDYKYEPSKSEANESLPNQSPTNSFEESKEEGGETCPPSKALKMTRSPGDDEILQQNTVKKARVSVRTRCETPTMNDGCQWRKYGQKIAKGNPCPRAYYRCTVAPSCPVRKQVQRCAEDMSILITTYEGTHNHPLPVAATAMASTTSAAASMLLSGSSSSSRFGSLAPSTTTPTSPANLHGLNFYLSDKPKPFYLPNTSLSSSSPYQTITLDLTTPSSSSQFNRFSSSNYAPTSRYNVTSSTSLNFSSSSESNSAVQWGNGLFTYNTTQPYMKNHVGNSSLGRVQPIENIYQSYMQKTNPNPNPPSLQQSLPADTIAAATKAITADPTFQSALAAAITSIIGTGDGSSSGGAGGGSSGNSGQVVTGDNYGQKLVKWGSGQVSVGSSYSSQALKSNNIGCATSFLNRSSSTSTTNNNSQSGNLILSLPPVNNNTPPFSNSKSASASPNNGNKDPN